MSPTPPQNTPEERAAALADALKARQGRAAIKAAVTAGTSSVGAVLDAGHRGQGNSIAGRIEVGDLVVAVPGIGPVKAAKILSDAGIADGEEHLDELSADQVASLKAALGG